MSTSHPHNTDRSVVERTLSILECFNTRNTALTVSEISRRSGLPVATTYRIVAKLLSWGALERGTGNRYSIGLRLWEVASLTPRHSALRSAAIPHMVQLQRETNSPVFLSVRDRLEGVWLEGVWGNGGPWHGSLGTGNRFPLYASAFGRVLLAHADPAVQDEVYSGGLRALTEHTATDPLILRSLVNEVKTRGYAVADSELFDGVWAAAAPVRDGSGAVVASVGLCRDSADDGALYQRVRPVLAAARRLSQELAQLQPNEDATRRRPTQPRVA
ncbi:IclR family transcriptional regulator [Streptomyces chartreusis]|uniref:IclR family transcriptional regulator n=1 Tax=Streptomyces chartreusis TaxID=1969 RepID=UPI004064656B